MRQKKRSQGLPSFQAGDHRVKRKLYFFSLFGPRPGIAEIFLSEFSSRTNSSSCPHIHKSSSSPQFTLYEAWNRSYWGGRESRTSCTTKHSGISIPPALTLAAKPDMLAMWSRTFPWPSYFMFANLFSNGAASAFAMRMNMTSRRAKYCLAVPDPGTRLRMLLEILCFMIMRLSRLLLSHFSYFALSSGELFTVGMGGLAS